jgi:hypothetical protein
MSDRSPSIRSSLLCAKVDEFTLVRSGPPIDRTLLGMTATIRTPDQRLRVFVSSTLAEMAEERTAVAPERVDVHKGFLRVSDALGETEYWLTGAGVPAPPKRAP